jgi:hypothetical protein
MWKQTHIVNQLKLFIHTKDTKYKLFILVGIACAFYKLVQGCNLLICNELFVVSWSTIFLVVREVIIVINIAF